MQIIFEMKYLKFQISFSLEEIFDFIKFKYNDLLKWQKNIIIIFIFFVFTIFLIYVFCFFKNPDALSVLLKKLKDYLGHIKN